MKVQPRLLLALAALWPLTSISLRAEAAKPPAKNPTNRGSDANGNPLRLAPATGHVSNYDEAKVGTYTLPDPLVRQNGQPVRDAKTWLNERRPEILALYEHEIYGRVPAAAPKVSCNVASVDTAMDGAAKRKQIVMRFGDAPDAPTATLMLYLPANATGRVPVLLHMVFFSGLPGPQPEPAMKGPGGRGGGFSESGPVADILGRGYGYATLRYTDIEGDRADNSLSRVRKLALAAGQDKPAADDWGTITAWAWGASRALDYFETDSAVDAKRVAIIGHSRLGKTALWTGARDPRFALVYASCSGELGASLARRDFGETVDDVTANFPWWFAANFQKYAGHWNDLPVDAHELIALSAPRPVFVTGGTKDQWADPKGEFLAEVAAGPVYRLLGAKDLGTTELPPLDAPQIDGDLGWNYHTGGHAITEGDWKAFLDFADRHLQAGRK